MEKSKKNRKTLLLEIKMQTFEKIIKTFERIEKSI